MSLGCYTFSSEYRSEGGAEMNHQLLEVTQGPPFALETLDGALGPDVSAPLEQI